MKLLARTLAILGLGLTGALVHSWASPVKLDAPPARAGKALPSKTPGAGTDATGGNETSPNGSESSQGQTQSQTQNQGQSRTGDDPSTVVSDPGDAPEEPWRSLDPATFETDLTLDQTRFLYQYVEAGDGSVVFLDARGIEGEYEKGHIAGALAMAYEDIASQTVDFQDLANGPTDIWIVVYCGGGDCDESKNVRVELSKYGFQSVYIFVDGYPAWAEAGLPTARGEFPWGE